MSLTGIFTKQTLTLIEKKCVSGDHYLFLFELEHPIQFHTHFRLD